jgi:hypothetical protein
MVSSNCNMEDADLELATFGRANLRGALNLDMDQINPKYHDPQMVNWPRYLREEARQVSSRRAIATGRVVSKEDSEEREQSNPDETP